MKKPESKAEMLRRLQNQPPDFFRMCWPDIYLWDRLLEVCDAVTKHRHVGIRSGHGIGKSWLMARLALWFLTVYKPSIVITTAPTARQVEKILWGEIHRAHGSSHIPLGGKLLQTELKIDDDNYAIGFSTDTDVSQREFGSAKLQGFHMENLLVLLDEAAGIPMDIWIGLSSLLTGENNRVVAIGNPASPTGPFYDIFKNPIWHKIQISCYDHPNVKTGKIIVPGAVTQEWIEERKAEWGENSPLFTAKVKGDFPTEGTDTLIPLSWVERATNNEDVKKEGAKAIGGDIARFGDDETTIFKAEGNWFDLVEAFKKKDTMETTGRLIKAKTDAGAEFVAVDDSGVGGGVTDRLRELGVNTVPINFGSGSSNPERFVNLKAEIFWTLREDMEKGLIRIPNDPVLVNQLASIKFSITSKGQVKIEGKDEMKKRGLKSPDRADGLAICHYSRRTNWMPEVVLL